jgi:lipopolysaccharide transport system ATP-binding protein
VTTAAIATEGLGKRYRIGRLTEQATTLREAIVALALAPARRARGALSATENDFVWALRDVSLEIDRGEVVGLIGRNGAGKTTLLKILARITEPTAGRARIEGRLASLLEVGTGFHSELTGRENVMLNGAILGMRRAEILAKFDDIVEFAGVEKFVDTPVKRYSTGMHTRLAFSVAAHLDADILLVDEVLAVGDQEFQERSLGKMDAVTREGRTVVFVSHNMASIKALCRRAVLLDAGTVVRDGPVDVVVNEYLARVTHAGASDGEIGDAAGRIGTGEGRFRRVAVLDRAGDPSRRLFLGQPLTISAAFEAEQPIGDAIFEFGISTLDGVRVATAFSTDGDRPPLELAAGTWTIALDLDLVLLPGRYVVDLGVHHTGPPYTIDWVERVHELEVVNVAERGGDTYPQQVVRGFLRPGGSWRAPERA